MTTGRRAGAVVAAMAAALTVAGPLAAEGLEARDYTFMGRALERLLIVAFAGCALYFGYRLFHVTAHDAGELMASGRAWKLRLVRVGPGVFFALFGSAVLAYALHVAPTEKTTPDGTTSTLRGSMPGAQNVPRDQGRDALLAINTVRFVSALNLGTAEQQAELKRAAEALEPLQRQLVDALLGPGRYLEWAAVAQRRTTDPAGVTRDLERDPALRRRVIEIDDLLAARLLPRS